MAHDLAEPPSVKQPQPSEAAAEAGDPTSGLPVSSGTTLLLLGAAALIGFLIWAALYRDPGRELLRRFPGNAAAGQAEFDGLARRAMTAVRTAADASAELERQKHGVSSRLLFGEGTVSDSGRCGLTSGRSKCNYAQIQRGGGPILWMYTSESIAPPDPGAWVAFEGCRVADIGVNLGASLTKATDATWWITCDAATAPTKVGTDGLALWEKGF